MTISAPLTYKNRDAADELSKYAEVQKTDESGRFYLFDSRETVFLIMDKTNSYDSAVWVKSPFFTSAMDSLSSNKKHI